MRNFRLFLPIFLLLILSIFWSGCSFFYVPNQVNVPMLTDRNDVTASASIGLSGTDIQAAYSPVSNLGIMANVAYKNPSDNNMNSLRFAEGGIGYYVKLREQTLFDIYAGAGAGDRFTNFPGSWSSFSGRGRYTRLFLQPSVSFISDYFDSNFAVRMCQVNMRLFSPNIENYNNILIEPTLTVKYGYKYVKIINQIGLSLPASPSEYGHNPLIFNVGLNFNLRQFN